MEESPEQMVEAIIGYARQLKNRRLRRIWESLRDVRWGELTPEDRAQRLVVLRANKYVLEEVLAMQGRVQKAAQQ